jgi:hypothetical protein
MDDVEDNIRARWGMGRYGCRPFDRSVHRHADRPVSARTSVPVGLRRPTGDDRPTSSGSAAGPPPRGRDCRRTTDVAPSHRWSPRHTPSESADGGVTTNRCRHSYRHHKLRTSHQTPGRCSRRNSPPESRLVAAASSRARGPVAPGVPPAPAKRLLRLAVTSTSFDVAETSLTIDATGSESPNRAVLRTTPHPQRAGSGVDPDDNRGHDGVHTPGGSIVEPKFARTRR